MTWIIPGLIAAFALGLSVYQEVRHRLEAGAKIQVDVRTFWRKRGSGDLVDLIVLDLVAFNPSLRGFAISHLRVEVRDRPDVSFDLARPRRVGSEWQLEPLGSSAVMKVSGDFDLPYAFPPINLPARQGQDAIVAFIPSRPVKDLDPQMVHVFCRVGSYNPKTDGILGWRRRFNRRLPPFEEVEARWFDAGIQYAGTKLSAP